MAKFYRSITDDLKEFMGRQKIFFTATAPSDGARVNLSPKGYDSLAILDDHTLCYYDLPGSGNETANHIEDNGRLTLMMCSFDEKPLILRIYCAGEVVGPADPRFSEWMASRFPAANPAIVRQIIVGRVEAAQTSCGYAVPFFEYQGERPLLTEWAETKKRQGKLEEYMEANSARNDSKFPLGPV